MGRHYSSLMPVPLGVLGRRVKLIVAYDLNHGATCPGCAEDDEVAPLHHSAKRPELLARLETVALLLVNTNGLRLYRLFGRKAVEVADPRPP